MLAFIIDWAVKIIGALGYPGVFFLMMLESMIFPIPSEAIMPFAGFLIAQGKFGLWAVTLVATLGGLLGSWLSYWIGKYGGIPLALKIGKYIGLDQHHLEWTHNWFLKHGISTVFIGRFIPIIRHLISIPAGIGKMPALNFTLVTLVGAFLWNLFLTYVGFKLGENWEIIRQYTSIIDIIVLLFIAAGIVYIIWHWKKIRHMHAISEQH